MKRHFLVMVVLGLALGLMGAPAWGDDFYVIAGGGPSGKVLKTQVFTSNQENNTLGTSTWAKLDYPQWTYTKVSDTSYLVITYQDSVFCLGGNGFYQVRVNGQPSVAGDRAAALIANDAWKICGATGIWNSLPRATSTCPSGTGPARAARLVGQVWRVGPPTSRSWRLRAV